MSTERYSSTRDRTMQGGAVSVGQTISRRCDEPRCGKPRCGKPMAQGRMWRGLRYCPGCYEAKVAKREAA